MFFDLTMFSDASKETRPTSFYMLNGKPVMDLDAPMIIFCDAITEPMIRTLRVNPKTVYVSKPLIEYDYFTNSLGLIQSNREKSNGYKSSDRNTVTYLLMGMFKVLAIQLANKLNPFQSTHFAWVDFGCNHFIRGVKTAAQLLHNSHNKVAVTYIHYRSHAELNDMRRYMEYGAPCGIASTVYTVESAYADRYASAMFSVFYDMLTQGYGHTDETCMVYCYDRYPDLFTLRFGDYYSVITNYHNTTEDIDAIKNYFIGPAIQCNRRDLAEIAINAIA